MLTNASASTMDWLKSVTVVSGMPSVAFWSLARKSASSEVKS